LKYLGTAGLLLLVREVYLNLKPSKLVRIKGPSCNRLADLNQGVDPVAVI